MPVVEKEKEVKKEEKKVEVEKLQDVIKSKCKLCARELILYQTYTKVMEIAGRKFDMEKYSEFKCQNCGKKYRLLHFTSFFQEVD